jgi:hypothetical protein
MTTTVMFSSAFVQDLSDAMSEPDGTMEDVFAVVASVGPWERQQYSPFGTREICLVDTRSVVKLCLFIMLSPMVDLRVNTNDYFFVMCSDRVAFLRVYTTYGQGHSAVFAEVDLRNKFVMPTKVLVNHDRGLASLLNSKILL